MMVRNGTNPIIKKEIIIYLIILNYNMVLEIQTQCVDLEAKHQVPGISQLQDFLLVCFSSHC